jgi:glutathione S-transferase
MKLLGVCLSPFVRKVGVVLNLKGIACEREDSLPGTIDRAISPLGKVPALVDGEVALADSSVICEYLEEQYPAVRMLPQGVAERARSRWLEELSDSKLAELCGGGIFFERVLKKVLHSAPADEAKVRDVIENQLPPILDYFEGQIPAQGFVFGALPGIADISIATHFVNAGYAGYAPDAARWPRLTALIGRVKALPAMQTQLAAEAAFMAAMGVAPQA